jgi:hypothetical protein
MTFKSYFTSLLFVFITAFFLISCEENISPLEIDGESITLNRIYPSLDPEIPDSLYSIVQNLFNRNNLSLTNLKVFMFTEHDNSKYIRCYQYYQSMEMFTNDVVFWFDRNDNYFSLGGDLINQPDLSGQVNVNMYDAAKIFYDNLKTDFWYKDSLSEFCSRGFTAELGIYDLNAGTSDSQKNFVYAWRIKVFGKDRFPVAYIRADSLLLIYYTNGVIIG